MRKSGRTRSAQAEVTEGGQVLLAAHNVGLSYAGHEDVLRDVNLQLGSREFVAVLGPSGCGKTSLLRLLAGLEGPTTGRIERGDDMRIGYVFQDPNLLAWRDVEGNICLPLQLQKQGWTAEQLRTSLRMIGLQDSDRKKYPRMLSGGMRMRVSLARALILRPQALLLDEPFAALDDLLRQELNTRLLDLWLEQHWGAVFVTHNVSEAVFLSQRVLVMGSQPGRVAAEVPVPFSYPRDADLRCSVEFAGVVSDVTRQLRSLAN